MANSIHVQRVPILETKFRPPAPRGDVVARESLYRRLDAALSGRLVVVAAPAGFGKTTLIERWVRRLGPQVTASWISFDEKDREPHRFWPYAVEGFRRMGVEVDSRLAAKVAGDPAAAEDVVAAGANVLAGLHGRQVLVLDNMHFALGPEGVSDALFRLIEAIPTSATVVLVSRSLPSWPIERLLVQGDAVVIGPDELAFDRGETAALLSTATGERLDDFDVDTLHRRSEGWPVAIGLTARGLARGAGLRHLLAEFGGADRLVAGYLLEEVLSGLSPATHQFLLNISVLDRISVELASAVVDGPVDDIVHELIFKRVLLVPIDDHGEWMRLHRLVRDLLLADLMSSDPVRARELHRRAALWYREQDDIDAAIEHLSAAGDHDATASLIEATFERQVVLGDAESVISWLRRLPAEQLEIRPRSASLLARMLVLQGRFDEARGWIDVADRASRTDGQRLEVMIARLRLESALGDETAVLATLSELDLLVEIATDPEAKHAARTEQAGSLVIRANCHDYLGDRDRFDGALAEMDRRRGELAPEAAVTVDPLLARASAEVGELSRAASRAYLAMERAERHGLDFQALTHAHLALAQVAWCRGQLHEAETWLRSATQLDRGVAVWLRTIRAVRAAEIGASLGRYDRVADVLESAWDGVPGARTPSISRWWIAAWGIVVGSIHRRRDSAQAWLSELDRLDGPLQVPPDLWAHIELLRGYPELVIDRFGWEGKALPAAPLPKLRCGLALVHALHLGGRDAQAATLSGSLLDHAERHELLQPVIDYPLVVRAAERTGDIGVSDRFLGQLRSPNQRSIDPGVSVELVEQISPRELDLVRLLPSRLTNQEIATELYVSLNTVKTHLRNIYRKLGTPNRDAAIARCEELGLL